MRSRKYVNYLNQLQFLSSCEPSSPLQSLSHCSWASIMSLIGSGKKNHRPKRRQPRGRGSSAFEIDEEQLVDKELIDDTLYRPGRNTCPVQTKIIFFFVQSFAIDVFIKYCCCAHKIFYLGTRVARFARNKKVLFLICIPKKIDNSFALYNIYFA
jgi:hypothetical protein